MPKTTQEAPRGSDSRARAVPPTLRLRISCKVHDAWHCAWIVLLEKEEIMMDFPFSVG